MKTLQFSIYFLIALAIATSICPTATAQSKLAIRSGVHINLMKDEIAAMQSRRQAPSKEQTTVNMLITIKNGSADNFRDIPWLTVNTIVRNVMVADVNINHVDELMSRDDVLYGQISEAEEPTMYYARMEKNANINKAHSDPGHALGKAYLGEGVVCGVFDTGFDINHITFYDNEHRDVTRVKRLVLFEGSSATPVLNTTDPVKIKQTATDRRDAHHGCHVLGIMAGGFRGMGRWQDFDYGADSVSHQLFSSSPNFPSHDQNCEPVAYYGSAPKADIVLCGTRDGIYEGQQITSAEAIISYAKKNGMPCVINHSFGSQWGPRDGSGSYGDLMDAFAEDAIICKAAGNDGTCDDYFSVTLTPEQTSVATIMQFARTEGNKAEVEYWLSDNQPIEVEIFFAGTFKVPGMTARQWVEIPFRRFSPDREPVDLEQSKLTFITITPDDLPAELAGAFSGRINIGMGVAAQNNRFTVDVTFTDNYATNSVRYNDSNSVVETGIRIIGQPGQRVDGNSPGEYCKFSQTFSKKGSDYVGGSPCMSIAEGSCCRKVIAVGSYSARTSYKYLNGDVYYTGATGKEGGNIAPSSGYGKTFDGRILPHVAAPGVNIISAENRFYADRSASDVVASATVNGISYDFIEMSGTSMACPAFAGIVALWLEADPTQKYEDIIDVLAHTCRHDQWTDAAPERFGYGKVDAYEGLKYVLARKGAGVQSATVDPDEIMITPIGSKAYEVTIGCGETFRVTLTSLNGHVVISEIGTDTVTVDATSLSSGVYIMTINNGKFSTSKKICIK